jgi:hypothetical protein
MKLRLLFPAIYGTLFAAGLVWMFALEDTTAFCGVPAVLLTLPWNLLLVPVFRAIDPSFAGTSIALCVCALLNGAVCFAVGAAFERGRRV